MIAALFGGGGPMWAACAAKQSEGKMEKYGTTNQCPKCGEKRFADGIVYGPYGLNVVDGSGKDKFRVYFSRGEVEIMNITCSKCGYKFNELPLDHCEGE
jgi:C4-type Zn-finger protein